MTALSSEATCSLISLLNVTFERKHKPLRFKQLDDNLVAVEVENDYACFEVFEDDENFYLKKFFKEVYSYNLKPDDCFY